MGWKEGWFMCGRGDGDVRCRMIEEVFVGMGDGRMSCVLGKEEGGGGGEGGDGMQTRQRRL